jgi:two-component system, sensor histidine kinase YesM
MKLNTLQKKIMLAFSLLLIGQIIVYALVTYWFETRIIYEQVAEANLNTLKEMRNHLEVEIRILDRISDQLSSSEILQNYLREINQPEKIDIIKNNNLQDTASLLDSTQQIWPEIYNLHIYNIFGNIVSLKDRDIALPIPELKEFENKSVQLDYGVQVNQNSDDKGTIVSYLRLVKDVGNGKPLGWVRLDLNTSDIDFIQGLNKDSRMFFVFEPNGKLILSSKPESIDIVLIAKLLNIKDKSGSFFYDDNLINYNTSNLTGWKIVSIVPEKLLSEGILKVKITSILLITISIFVSIVSSIIISHKVTRPLKTLYNSMKNIEKGNFKTKVKVTSNDEIGKLSNQLNIMAKSIDNMINQVYKVELKFRDAQFRALLTQINPHFLYNTLEIIDVLSLKGKQNEVSKVVYSLSSM